MKEHCFTGVYRLADHSVSVESHERAVHEMCQGYRSEGAPDFEVCIQPEDIGFERRRADAERNGRKTDGTAYSDAYLETLAVYRKISEKMPEYDTFLFHGSAIAVDGAAYIFTARSGTGKSTHARLWREMLGDGAVMVNDDKPLIKVHPDGAATVYGTPWDGKHRLSSNIAVTVQAICILERAAENHIREIAKPEALPMLLQQAYRPRDPAALEKTLTLIDRLNVKLFRLGCNRQHEAAEVSYNAMKGKRLSFEGQAGRKAAEVQHEAE
ncbi:MAG: hypothetical protein IJ174_06640 [Clostridia bacterium]|nr:hypothetical protein [Clostridia bacterium]